MRFLIYRDFLRIYNERLKLGHSKRTPSISAEASIGLVNSLLKPARKLAPNKTCVIVFVAFVHAFLLILDRHHSFFTLLWIIANITLSYLNLLASAL